VELRTAKRGWSAGVLVLALAFAALIGFVTFGHAVQQ
jgi:hypothetical protein